MVNLEHNSFSTVDSVAETGTLKNSYKRELAVIRFRGKASARDVAQVRERLLKALEEAKVPLAGTPFLMRYNPPFTPGFLRRNEVGVEIRRGNS